MGVFSKCACSAIGQAKRRATPPRRAAPRLDAHRALPRLLAVAASLAALPPCLAAALRHRNLHRYLTAAPSRCTSSPRQAASPGLASASPPTHPALPRCHLPPPTQWRSLRHAHHLRHSAHRYDQGDVKFSPFCPDSPKWDSRSL
ncbi:hypothetical protein Fmac_008345 [Flemingia macrophylla]|uniref:Uncharacterized protein n=1 Tax=Flemingia macrophylla TaxID=520843 RepID=A0ABD1MX65_9FABA